MRLLGAALVASAAVLSPATPPQARSFGIVAFDFTGPTGSKLAELGVGIVRGSCSWESLEPARGEFQWDCADHLVVPAGAQRLRSYLTVTCTPGWANGGRGCARMPADITDWYDFVANFVSRYARHDVILGVWNEPNLTLAHDDGSQYALLYVNASRARDAIDPDFVVAGPETSHHALASGYLQRALDVVQSWRAIAPQDVVAVHWYGDGPPILTYLDAVHTAAGGRDVWLSETGLAARDVQEQASFYDTMLGRFADEARPPWWTHIIFYRLWDGQVCCSDAILNADFSHRPAFDVYRRWVADSVRRPRDGIVRIPTSE